MSHSIQPFLKWAGGKRWLASNYGYLLPSHYNNYVEPFLGGAAMFFHLRPSSAILSDTNQDLISTYQVIKENWAEVWEILELHSEKHDDDYYYNIRSENPHSLSERAARFIYLNRTCWNGLYRVNKKGLFNVPRGTRDSILFSKDDFSSVATCLQNSTIISEDFEIIVDSTRKGDFVFIDPPYTVKHNCNGFQRYNEKIFRWSDQERLAACVERARDRGVMLLVTNAAHDSIRDLYGALGEQVLLNRLSLISGDSAKRDSTQELAIVIGYIPDQSDDDTKLEIRL